ncbi:ABC transporter substrate-binding protein [Lachnospiraceae bacterium 54-53]
MSRASKAKTLGAVLAAALLAAGCAQTKVPQAESTKEAPAGTEAAETAKKEQELTKVVVLGEFDPQISGQQIIAKEKGFFEEEGLDVDLQLLTDPSVSTAMVAANEAQFYSISNYQAINLADKGGEVCILAPVVDAGNTQCVVGGPNLELGSARDLEGKKMGYTDGAGVIVAVKAMCDDLGVDFDAIELVNLQASDMLASLESGEIDFFAAWEPWGIKAEEFGGSYLFTGTRSYLPENEGEVKYLNFEVCIDVSKSFLKENPEACGAYVRAMIKATGFINENMEEAAGIVGKGINLDAETCLAIMKKNDYQVAFNQTFKDSCDTLAQYMQESGLNTGLVEFEKIVDTSVLSGIDSALVAYQ